MRAWWVAVLALVTAPAVAGETAASTALVVKARRAVAETLKDAPSARFRLVRKGNDRDRVRVCGEVNSKNGFGGYTGFQKFVYFSDTGETFILDEDSPSPSYVKEQAALFGSCF